MLPFPFPRPQTPAVSSRSPAAQWLNLMDVLHRLRRVGVRIVVKALAGFAPMPAGQDQPPQQTRRREARLAELFKQDVGDVAGRVEPDKIRQRKRTHGMSAAE